ncbi:MAG TPA: hypothetical protein VFJ58_01430 [Armatimonadota bacterium]|nr:hypothetical protein [Armatimonadota bacterium]
MEPLWDFLIRTRHVHDAVHVMTTVLVRFGQRPPSRSGEEAPLGDTPDEAAADSDQIKIFRSSQRAS